MRKIKKKVAAPDSPVDNRSSKEWEHSMIYGRFSLVDPPTSHFQYNSLFYSYDLEKIKEELQRIKKIEKENKYDIDTQSLREQLRLIKLLTDAPDGVTYLKWEFEQENALRSELLYSLAKQGNDEAFLTFNAKIHEDFWRLKRMALDGHQGALQSLATLAIAATEIVNQVAVKNPEIFAIVAANATHWPFLKSKHKKLNPLSQDAEDSFLRRMPFGKNTQLNLSNDNRYDPGTATNQVALRLLKYLIHIHTYATFHYHHNVQIRSAKKLESDSILKRAMRLPKEMRTQSDRDAWWELAKQCLLESYPALNPTSTADISSIDPKLLALAHVRNPKNRRKRILYNIFRAFDTILAKNISTAVTTPAHIIARLKNTDPILYKKL